MTSTYPFVRPISDEVLERSDKKMSLIRIGGYAVGIDMFMPEQYAYFANIIDEARNYLRLSNQHVDHQGAVLGDAEVVEDVLLSEWRLDQEVRMDEVMLFSMVMTGFMTVQEHEERKFTIGEVAYVLSRARCELVWALTRKFPTGRSPLIELSDRSQDPRITTPSGLSFDIFRTDKTGFDVKEFWAGGERDTMITLALRNHLQLPSALFWLWASRFMYEYHYELVDRSLLMFSTASHDLARESFISQTIASDAARYESTGLEFYQLVPYLMNDIRDEAVIASAVEHGSGIDLDILRALSEGGAA